MKTAGMPFSWVDLMTVAVLIVGILRGRKRGLSEEFLDTLQWIAIVLVAGLFYGKVAALLSERPIMSPAAYGLISYTLLAIGVKIVVLGIKRIFGDKLIGSDVFGRGEYYLGMAAGAVRFFCMYVAFMSFLHAPHYTAEMLAAEAKSQEYNFGDIRFPTIGGMQHAFFTDSATGYLADKYIEGILVKPSAVNAGELRNDKSLAKRREQSIDAIMGGK